MKFSKILCGFTAIVLLVLFASCGRNENVQPGSDAAFPFEQIAFDSAITFGGTKSTYFNRVIPTGDGGYLAMGNTLSKDIDGEDAEDSWKQSIGFVVKYDKKGRQKWTRFFGGDNGVSFNDVIQISDGSFIIAGKTESSDFTENFYGVSDGIVVKLSKNGKLQWKKNFGGNDADVFNTVRQTSDGGFAVCGNTNSNDKDLDQCGSPETIAVLVKYNSAGEKQWQKLFGGSHVDNFAGMDIAPDGSIYVLCNTSSADKDMKDFYLGRTDCLVLKYGTDGTMMWKKSFSGRSTDIGTDLMTTSDGGFLLAGYYEKNQKLDGIFANHMYQGKKDCYLVKADENGNIQWTETFGGSDDDELKQVLQTGDKYLVIGSTKSKDGDFSLYKSKGEEDVFIKCYDKDGTYLLTESFGSSGMDVSYGACLLNHNLFIAGYTTSTDRSFKNLNPSGGQIAFLTKFVLK